MKFICSVCFCSAVVCLFVHPYVSSFAHWFVCLLCNSCVGSSPRSFASLLVPSLIRSHVRWSSRSFVHLLGYHSLSGLLYLLTRIFFFTTLFVQNLIVYLKVLYPDGSISLYKHCISRASTLITFEQMSEVILCAQREWRVSND